MSAERVPLDCTGTVRLESTTYFPARSAAKARRYATFRLVTDDLRDLCHFFLIFGYCTEPKENLPFLQ